jgi:hypothetical protein
MLYFVHDRTARYLRTTLCFLRQIFPLLADGRNVRCIQFVFVKGPQRAPLRNQSLIKLAAIQPIQLTHCCHWGVRIGNKLTTGCSWLQQNSMQSHTRAYPVAKYRLARDLTFAHHATEMLYRVVVPAQACSFMSCCSHQTWRGQTIGAGGNAIHATN